MIDYVNLLFLLYMPVSLPLQVSGNGIYLSASRGVENSSKPISIKKPEELPK
jgi:hypothetical protein